MDTAPIVPVPVSGAPGRPLGWRQEAALSEWYINEPHRFEFLQLIRLLSAAGEAPRLRASGGFAFPPSEVRSFFRSRDGSPAEVTTPLLSIDGAFGPLPDVYGEDRLRADRGRQPAFGDFLDIFHHRLLSVYFRIAEAHRPAMSSPDDGNRLGEALLSVAGLGVPGLRRRMRVHDLALARYAGLFGCEARSSHGMERMLEDYTGQPVRVREFLGRWAPLDEPRRTRLGHGAATRSLGSGAVLGGRAWVDSCGIEIGFGTPARPISRPAWMALLPGGWRHSAVADLSRLYLRSEHRVRLRLTIAGSAVGPSWLGAARLGHTSFLATRRASQSVEVTCPGELDS